MTPTVIRPTWTRAAVTSPGHNRGALITVSGEQHLTVSLPLDAWQRVGPSPLIAKLGLEGATPHGVPHLAMAIERGVVLLDVRVRLPDVRSEIRTADVALIASGAPCCTCGGR